MSGADATPVPNPEIAWLQQLLSQVQSVQASVPLLDKPTASIGPGPAWTGSKALDMHDHDLAPRAKAFRTALGALDGEVQDKINDVRAHTPTVSPATATLMTRNRTYG